MDSFLLNLTQGDGITQVVERRTYNPQIVSSNFVKFRAAIFYGAHVFKTIFMVEKSHTALKSPPPFHVKKLCMHVLGTPCIYPKFPWSIKFLELPRKIYTIKWRENSRKMPPIQIPLLSWVSYLTSRIQASTFFWHDYFDMIIPTTWLGTWNTDSVKQCMHFSHYYIPVYVNRPPWTFHLFQPVPLYSGLGPRCEGLNRNQPATKHAFLSR